MYYPSFRDMEIILERVNERYGMSEIISNKGQLDFALEKPKIHLGKNEQYPELYQKAALLMETITKLHPFSDGNKRCAMMAAEFMIQVNGGELVLPLKTIRLSVDVAQDEEDLMQEEIQKWFKVHAAMNVEQLSIMLIEHMEEEAIFRKLLKEKKFSEAETLADSWLAFDTYKEHKKAWNELVDKWKNTETSINLKKTEKGKEFDAWSGIWKTFAKTAQYGTSSYIDEHLDFKVESIDNLLYRGHSVDELNKIENFLSNTEKELKIGKNKNLLYQSAAILEKSEKYEEAIEFYKKLLEIDTDKEHPNIHIALIYQYSLQDYENAIIHWKKTIEYSPNQRLNQGNLGICLVNLRKYKDAIPIIEKLLKIKPKDFVMLNFMGICLGNLGRKEEALECFNKALKIDDKSVECLVNKGNTLSDMGKEEESIKCYDQALEIEPNDIDSLYNKAVSLNHLEKSDEERELYEKILEINSNDLQALIGMGANLSNRDKREEAIPYFERALKIEPTHRIALTNLAITYLYMKNFEKANQYYEIALKINKHNSQALYGKSIILCNQGKVIECLKMLEKAIKEDPKFKKIAKSDETDFFGMIKESEKFKKLVS